MALARAARSLLRGERTGSKSPRDSKGGGVINTTRGTTLPQSDTSFSQAAENAGTLSFELSASARPHSMNRTVISARLKCSASGGKPTSRGWANTVSPSQPKLRKRAPGNRRTSNVSRWPLNCAAATSEPPTNATTSFERNVSGTSAAESHGLAQKITANKAAMKFRARNMGQDYATSSYFGKNASRLGRASLRFGAVSRAGA